MPPELEDRVRDLTQAALEGNEEIRIQAKNSGLSPESEAASAAEAAGEIAESALQEEIALEEATTRLNEERAANERRVRFRRRISRVYQAFFGLGPISSLLGYWIWRANGTGRGYLKALYGWSGLLLTEVILALIGGGYLLLLLVRWYFAYLERSAQARRNAATRILEQAMEAADAAYNQAIEQKGLLPWLRERINDVNEKSYSSALAISSAPGLAELTESRFQIPTEAHDQLDALVTPSTQYGVGMPGGAIGISGPRGAGKSVLLRKFCAPRPERKWRQSDQPRDLRVLVAAPVEYEARDFVLNLFSTICRTILGRPEGEAPELPGARDSWSATASVLSRRLPALGIGVAVCGVVLLILGVAGVSLESTVVWGILLIIGGISVLLRGTSERLEHFLDRVGARIRWMTGQFNPTPVARESVAKGPAEDLAKKWASALRFQQSYSSGWSGSLKLPIGLEASLTGTQSLTEIQRTYPEIVDGLRQVLRAAAPSGRDRLRQPNLPGYDRVFIGIDEMDKIEADDDARRFLNEIKSLFGLERCYFLISVSENAMSSFERRGLPFRDVFDSSFDEIVYVDYLDREHARRLIRRRVIGLAEPFIDLSYCMSGGLARDLIRVARDMVGVGNNSRDLRDIAAALVRLDLGAKLRAIEVEAKRTTLDAEIAGFMVWLDQLAAGNPSGDLLFEQATNPPFTPQPLAVALAGATPTDDERKARQSLARLRAELCAFLHYSATVVQFFAMDQEAIIRAEGLGREPGGFDQLAKARQAFAIDTNLASKGIEAFRDAHGMSPPAPGGQDDSAASGNGQPVSDAMPTGA